jgi:hypothetical protein
MIDANAWLREDDYAELIQELCPGFVIENDPPPAEDSTDEEDGD